MNHTSNNVSFFDETPIIKISDVGVDPQDGSNNVENRDDVDEEEGEGVEEPRHFADEDPEDNAEHPEQPQIESVIGEEAVLLEVGLCLPEKSLNVLHCYLINIRENKPLRSNA